MRVGVLLMFLSRAALAQADARADVHAAFEEQLPPVVDAKPPSPARTQRAAEAGRLRAGRSLGHRVDGDLKQASQSANGQARAEEVRQNSRGGKPPKKP